MVNRLKARMEKLERERQRQTGGDPDALREERREVNGKRHTVYIVHGVNIGGPWTEAEQERIYRTFTRCDIDLDDAVRNAMAKAVQMMLRCYRDRHEDTPDYSMAEWRKLLLYAYHDDQLAGQDLDVVAELAQLPYGELLGVAAKVLTRLKKEGRGDEWRE